VRSQHVRAIVAAFSGRRCICAGGRHVLLADECAPTGSTRSRLPLGQNVVRDGGLQMGKIKWVMAAAMIVHASVGCSGSDPMPAVATPAFSPSPGTYAEPQAVTLSSTTASATIYYTVDGSAPTVSASVYTGPITISSSTTIKAIAIAGGYSASAVAIGTYNINLPAQAATPTFAPGPGTYTSEQSVTLSSTTAGATVYYTLDGSSPTLASLVYSIPIAVSTTTTINAIAVASGFAESGIAMGTYTINLPTQAATPTFSPPPGEYTEAQVVTLSCSTPGATIYYTFDDSGPSPGSTREYTGPIDVFTTTTIKAIGIADGYASSGTATGTYTIKR
jgi:hypothetical protein